MGDQVFGALFEWLTEGVDDRFGRAAAWIVAIALIAALPALILVAIWLLAR